MTGGGASGRASVVAAAETEEVDLSAAVSRDEGRTWQGWREVIRDPLRNEPPPPNGDHGVSYPYPTLTRDGKVVFSMWVQTGPRRFLVQLDPKWLDETRQAADFANRMDEWSIFGTKGVEFRSHPAVFASRVGRYAFEIRRELEHRSGVQRPGKRHRLPWPIWNTVEVRS